MTVNQTSASGSVPTPIASKLGWLRKKLFAWVILDGAVWIFWLALILIAVDFGLDWLFRMDMAQRGVMLVLMLAAVGAIVFYRLIAPLRRVPTDDALILEVEQRHKEIGQSLISGAQFARMGDQAANQGVSMEMVNATIQAGTRAAENVQFGDTLNQKKFTINMGLALVAFLGIGAGIACATLNVGEMGLMARRNLLLSNEAWPTDVHISVINAERQGRPLARGEAWIQFFGIEKSSKEMPVQVLVDRFPESSSAQKTHTCQRITEEDLEYEENRELFEKYAQVYKVTVNPIEIEGSFEFRGRAIEPKPSYSIVPNTEVLTERFHVKVVAQPIITSLAIEMTLPDYAGGTTHKIKPGQRSFFVKGSSMRLIGESNKPLVKAELQYIESKSDSPPSWELDISGSNKVSGSIPGKDVSGGMYQIVLHDADEVVSNEPTAFSINIVPDRIPKIRAEIHGISGMIVPTAMIPTTMRVKDDFAITKIDLPYRYRGEGVDALIGKDELPFARPVELYQQTAFSSALLSSTFLQGGMHPAMAVMGSTHMGVESQWPFSVAEFEYFNIFDIEPLKIPTDVTLTFEITAEDNDTLSGPSKGRSSEFQVRVVTEERLRTDLLRREKEQRQEFERLIKEQETLHIELKALGAKTREGTEVFDKKQRALLRDSQRLQKVIGTNIEEITERLQMLLIEAENNRLESEGSKFHRRLATSVILPMHSLTNKPRPSDDEEAEDPPNIPSVEEGLHKVRQFDMQQQFGDRAERLDAVVAEQEAILNIMRNIRDQMVKSESFQEAVQLLHELETLQKEVQQKTLDELDERLRKLFDEGGKAKPKADSDDKDSDGSTNKETGDSTNEDSADSTEKPSEPNNP